MIPLRTTILGFDFSKGSKHALAQAVEWVERCGGELVLAHATPGPAGVLVPLAETAPVFVDTSELDDAMRARLERVVHGFDDRKFKVRAELLLGAPGSSLLECIEREKADLTIVGADESGLRTALLGSVAETVAREAAGPVLVARGTKCEVTNGVVVGVDLSPHSRAALKIASEVATAFGAPLTVVYVTPPILESRSAKDDGKAVWRQVRASAEKTLTEWTTGLRAKIEIREGEPAKELLACMKEREAGLLILARRGRSLLERLLMGSVVSKVLRKAGFPVLVVPRARAKAGSLRT